MVPGIDSFREKFKDYTDYYTIIGGTACDILLTEADLPFRATKDKYDSYIGDIIWNYCQLNGLFQKMLRNQLFLVSQGKFRYRVLWNTRKEYASGL